MKRCNHKHCVHNSVNQITGGYNIPDGCTTEFDVECSRCKEIIGHYAYGSYDIDYMIKFQLNRINKIKALIKFWKHKFKNKNNKKVNIVIEKGKCVIK